MKEEGDGSKGAYVEYGNVRALWEIVERIGLIDVIDRVAPKRNGCPVGKLTVLMAINRCLDPMAKWEIPDWYQRTYLPELLKMDLPRKSGYQTLTRCLDYLSDDVQQDIEMNLASNVLKGYGLKPEMFIYDLTSTFVEGEGDAPILQYGYSRDHRPDAKQVNYALCVTMPDGIPLFHEAFPGNMVDSKTVKQTMRLFKDRHQMSGCLVVDRGIVTHGNVKEIVDERGIDLVGGLRMDNSVKRRVKDIPLDAYGPEFKCGKEVLRACELSLPILGKPRRCILYFSGDKAERDKKDRARRMNDVETQLADISTSLLRKGRGCKRKRDPLVSLIDQLLREKDCTHLFEWRFTGGRGGRRLKWKRNEDAIHEQEKLDGKYVLITTLSDPPGVILQIYRNRDRIERAFRITKEAIRIRPIWNRKESHIKAHLFICFLSYLLMSLLQRSLKEVEPGLTSVKALKRLSVLTRRVDRKITLPGGAKSLLKKLVILKR